MNVWGNAMTACTADRLLYLALHKCGAMGRGAREIMSRLVAPGMCVVDAGANVGLYTGVFSGLVGPGGKVISIEPEAANWRALTNSIRGNEWLNVEPHNCALDESSGSLVLVNDPWNSGNHSVKRPVDSQLGEPATIQARTIDEIAGGRRVDFIKMDVQGWELQALKGARNTLAANEELSVLLELWPEGLRRNGVCVGDILAFLQEFSFRFVEPANGEPFVCSDFGGYRDVLAVRL